MKCLCVFLLLLSGIISKCLGAFPIITYTSAAGKINIGNQAAIYADTNQTYTIHQILSGTPKRIYSSAMPNLGLSNHVYWATFNFVNISPEKLILKFNQPLLNEVTLYRADGKTLSEVTYSEKNVFFSRKYYYPFYAFDMNAGMGDTITYVLKFKSNEPIIFDVDIATESVIEQGELQQELLIGIFIGIIFVMFFYNLFIYFTVLDSSYLAYVFYIFCIGLSQITIPGYGFKYIWPTAPEFNDLSLILFATLATIFGIEFVKIFLKTKQHVPSLHKLFLLFEIIFSGILILYFADKKILAFTALQLLTFGLCICIIVAAIKIIHMGYRPAIFFLSAWLVLLLGSCIFIGKDFGLVPYNFFTAHSMQIGSALEVTLLSLALADRINILKKEKETSQALALNALQQNEMIITNQNTILEKKVAERTKEIEQANNALYKALSELEKAETRLMHTEKEISPDASNAILLKREPDDIFDLLTKYEMHAPSDNPPGKIIPLKTSSSTLDYSSIKEEIEQLLSGIEDGATRTAAVVKGLRVFSPLNDTDLKRICVTENINSVLTELHAEIAETINLTKNFSPLPQIECFPAKLNEVFINIINNALYAIKAKKDRADKGMLLISTYSDTKKIFISFKDNGIGMTDEVKAKIFEPFFTTKDIGNSSGLGMSVSLSIISDHNGTIELNTEYGKGTEVIITLPVNYTS